MQDEESLRAVAKDCVHCGFCLPACPTYQLWGEEMDSPRGRIHLVSQLLDGAELTDAAAEHFDRCLGCMACMTACPSGVQYDQLIVAARVWTEDAHDAALASTEVTKRPVRDRATRAAIFALFPYPRRLRAAVGPLRIAQRTRVDRVLTRSKLPARVSPTLDAALRLAPPPATRVRLPERVAAVGPRRAVVGMLTGCVQSVFFPQVNAATARVLATEGCDVIIPRAQGCCGALSLHSGREAEAADFAKRTIETFSRAGVDAVVVNSAGCGSAMKEYDRLLASGGADAFSKKVRDFSEVPRRAGSRWPSGTAAGQGRGHHDLPPGTRAADHRPATRSAARDTRPGADRTGRRRYLLRFGWRVQPAAARGRRRARPPQGGRGARGRCDAAHLGQPRLLAADQLGARRARRAHRRSRCTAEVLDASLRGGGPDPRWH